MGPTLPNLKSWLSYSSAFWLGTNFLTLSKSQFLICKMGIIITGQSREDCFEAEIMKHWVLYLPYNKHSMEVATNTMKMIIVFRYILFMVNCQLLTGGKYSAGRSLHLFLSSWLSPLPQHLCYSRQTCEAVVGTLETADSFKWVISYLLWRWGMF